MAAPRYKTTVTATLTRTGSDADASPSLAEIQTVIEYSIPGSTTTPVRSEHFVPTNTTIDGGGLVLANLVQITWFVPTVFRILVTEKDTSPVGPVLVILDRRYDFLTAENWADGEEHTFTQPVQHYTVTLKFKAEKL